MRVFIPKNWEHLRSELSEYGSIVEIRRYGEEIVCNSLQKDFKLVTSIELKRVVEMISHVFDFAAFLDFNPEYLRDVFGFEIPEVKDLDEVLKAPKYKSVLSILKDVKDAKIDECGAIGIFVGFVKGISNGKRVKWLEYEVYEEVFYEKLRELEERLKSYENIENAKVYHRVGRVMPKEDIVYIAVVGKSRKDIWKPLIDGIELVKSILPIWKKEVYFNGEIWVHDKNKI